MTSINNSTDNLYGNSMLNKDDSEQEDFSEFSKMSHPDSRKNMDDINNLQNNEEKYGELATGFLNNKLFIECVNNLLKDDTGETDDNQFINFFKEKKLSEYTSEHFSYISNKIGKFMSLEPESFKKCFTKIKNYKQVICNGGLISASLFFISNLITLFTTNIDIYKIKPKTEDYKNLISLHETFINNINKIFKKILDISKYYELKICGKISVLTDLAGKTYDIVLPTEATVEYKLFDKLNLSNIGFLNRLNNSFFGQVIILIFIAFILSKLINMFN